MPNGALQRIRAEQCEDSRVGVTDGRSDEAPLQSPEIWTEVRVRRRNLFWEDRGKGIWGGRTDRAKASRPGGVWWEDAPGRPVWRWGLMGRRGGLGSGGRCRSGLQGAVGRGEGWGFDLKCTWIESRGDDHACATEGQFKSYLWRFEEL